MIWNQNTLLHNPASFGHLQWKPKDLLCMWSISSSRPSFDPTFDVPNQWLSRPSRFRPHLLHRRNMLTPLTHLYALFSVALLYTGSSNRLMPHPRVRRLYMKNWKQQPQNNLDSHSYTFMLLDRIVFMGRSLRQVWFLSWKSMLSVMLMCVCLGVLGCLLKICIFWGSWMENRYGPYIMLLLILWKVECVAWFIVCRLWY